MVRLYNVLMNKFTNYDLRYRFNFSSQLLFNPMQWKPIIVSDEINGNTQVTISSRTSNPVQICLRHFGEIEVYHNIHCLDVYTSCKKI